MKIEQPFAKSSFRHLYLKPDISRLDVNLEEEREVTTDR